MANATWRSRVSRLRGKTLAEKVFLVQPTGGRRIPPFRHCSSGRGGNERHVLGSKRADKGGGSVVPRGTRKRLLGSVLVAVRRPERNRFLTVSEPRHCAPSFPPPLHLMDEHCATGNLRFSSSSTSKVTYSRSHCQSAKALGLMFTGHKGARQTNPLSDISSFLLPPSCSLPSAVLSCVAGQRLVDLKAKRTFKNAPCHKLSPPIGTLLLSDFDKLSQGTLSGCTFITPHFLVRSGSRIEQVAAFHLFIFCLIT